MPVWQFAFIIEFIKEDDSPKTFDITWLRGIIYERFLLRLISGNENILMGNLWPGELKWYWDMQFFVKRSSEMMIVAKSRFRGILFSRIETA